MHLKEVKLMRITTVPLSLDVLLVGQLRFLSQYFEVIAVSSGGRALTKVNQREGVRTIAVHMERDISVVKDIRSFFALLKLLKREQPLIIHANTPKASLLSMIGGWVCRVPYRIYTVTGLRFEGERAFKKTFLIWMERITCFFATNVIPEGNGVKRKMESYRLTSKPLKVLANGNINGIDVNYFSSANISQIHLQNLKTELCINPGDMVFIFVGRMVKDKGVEELVEAFTLLNNELPSSKLLLLGSFEPKLDPLSQETLFKMRNNKAIKVVGYKEDIRPYLSVANVLVLPSYREGFPNVVLQGGAMGLPSIVSDIDGCNEIIKHDTNGLIVPRKNISELYKAMKLLCKNGELYHKLKSNARTSIVERYEQRMVWKALLNEYCRIILTNRSGVGHV